MEVGNGPQCENLRAKKGPNEYASSVGDGSGYPATGITPRTMEEVKLLKGSCYDSDYDNNLCAITPLSMIEVEELKRELACYD